MFSLLATKSGKWHSSQEWKGKGNGGLSLNFLLGGGRVAEQAP